jgi:hypothetical protein
MPLRDASDHTQRLKEEAWKKLCRESGWVCKLSGATPEVGGCKSATNRSWF